MLMKESAITGKVISNIYIRNASVLFILLSADVSKKIIMAGSFSLYGFLYTCVVFPVLYLLIVFHNLVLYEKLFRQKRYFLYTLCAIAPLLLYNEYFLPPMRARFQIWWNPESITDKLLMIYGYLVYVYLGLGIYIGFKYYLQREDSMKLAYLKRELELK